MRFCSLGSGSTGNATLVESIDPLGRATRLLIDCGLSLKGLARRLAPHGIGLDDIDAVFVTHEHSDHVGSVLRLVARHRAQLWTAEGTWLAMRRDTQAPTALSFARDGEAIVVGGLELTPFAVPHDACEPLQLTVTDGRSRLGVLTDLGESTAGVVSQLQACDALLLECNHDERMLADGPYPAFLKRRIGGSRGHLANGQSAALLAACRHGGLKHVVAAHLSRHNNRPALAAAALAAVLGTEADDIVVADPVAGSPWLSLQPA